MAVLLLGMVDRIRMSSYSTIRGQNLMRCVPQPTAVSVVCPATAVAGTAGIKPICPRQHYVI